MSVVAKSSQTFCRFKFPPWSSEFLNENKAVCCFLCLHMLLFTFCWSCFGSFKEDGGRERDVWGEGGGRGGGGEGASSGSPHGGILSGPGPSHHALGGTEPADSWAGETGAGAEGKVKGQLWIMFRVWGFVSQSVGKTTFPMMHFAGQRRKNQAPKPAVHLMSTRDSSS